MARKSRSELKGFFVKNAIPTEGNFADLADSPLNQTDDGVFRQAGQPLAVVAAPSEQRPVLQLYAIYPSANPDWLISLNPKDPADNAANISGFGLTDAAGTARLVLDATGNLTVRGTLRSVGGASLGGSTSVAGILSATANGPILRLYGADHAYLEFWPRGLAAGRQAWIGYGNTGRTELQVRSEGGELWLSGTKVVVNNDLYAASNLAVTGILGVGTTAQPSMARVHVAGGGLAISNSTSSLLSAAHAAVHVWGAGGLGRMLQMSPALVPDQDALNIVAATEADSNEMWFAWGVTTANKWRINPGSAFAANTGLTIDGEGRVGIGTESPTAALHVDGDTAVKGDLQVTSTGSFGGGCIFVRGVIPLNANGDARLMELINSLNDGDGAFCAEHSGPVFFFRQGDTVKRFVMTSQSTSPWPTGL